MRVLIRADAGHAAGAGHVMRTAAVAERARALSWDVMLSADLSAVGWVKPWVRALGVDLLGAVPARSLPSLARETSADLVVLDHYGHPDVRPLVNAAGAALVNVEDDDFGRRSADVVIDYGLASELVPRPDDGSGRLLRGIQYAPIRTAVREARARRSSVGGPAKRVAVLMGGTDAGELAATVSAAVEGAGAEVVHLSRGVAMLDGLADADAVVSAAGVSSYELCCLGIPTALVQVADNQQRNYSALTEAGAVHGLGRADELSVGAGLALAIRDWLADTERLAAAARTGRSLVDGHGADRIVAALHAAV